MNNMSEPENNYTLPDEVVTTKIYFIRNNRVMIDTHLAELYEVDTKQLKRAVRRNISRFPSDFMFELSETEFTDLRSQFGTSSWGGHRYAPMAFTEQGVAMLSSILNSERAIAVNIQIIRIFSKMRQITATYNEILTKLEILTNKDIEQDQKFELIFDYLKQFDYANKISAEQLNRNKIGYLKNN